MNRTLVEELNNKLGEIAKVQGWVQRIRKLGKIAFIILRDRSGSVQCVVNTKNIDINGLKLESVVEITGKVALEKNIEIQLISLDIISEVEENIPIEINKDKIQANLDTVLNNRVLSLRHKTINSVFKIEACLAEAFEEFLIEHDFTQIFTPKIVAGGAEGGTEVFELKYFEQKAYLAQSPQFYKQMMVGAGYERVFEIGHVYRAEEHNTNRHLNEYVSLDFEMAFIEDENNIIDIETELLKSMIEKVKSKCQKELEILAAELPEIKDKIPSMQLPEAIKILRDVYGKDDLVKDIDPEGERLISKYVKDKYNSDFVFLTHYSAEKRPMYTMPTGDGLTHSFDLIFRGVEITTGGQRIHSYEMLKRNMEVKGLNPEDFQDYLQVFKYGMPPHGGLAIGLERLTAQLLGLKNIREAALFPRDRERITP
ncbi:aspartate--tRNA(Asn) ligase [Clostridium pasteurianum]|uniref:Aspartate--tRNA ligase n=1 Tax=Clostridium pasteurianum BC1 TaxID=86416 RepID=R4JXN5_CLOPA|nr:aspartate--tRNA(Asn) ligase [Clostridium pasteurianum]AGK95567.1 aspartyl-tRNA synthetase, archaeal type [Clostridium pasteurianum BC1]